MQFKLLLIDDNVSEHLLMQEAIFEAGLESVLELEFISDAEKAIPFLEYQQAEDSLPEMIFLDLNMPKISGLDLLRDIKENPLFGKVLVYVVTNSDNKKDMVESFRLNADGYLQKPCDFGQMVLFFDAVRKAIEKVNRLSILYIDKYYTENILAAS